VGEALDLPTLDLEDLARGHLDALARRRDGARRRLERAGVDSLPHDLENGRIAAHVLGDERRLRVRDGLGPALPGLDDLIDALYAPSGGHVFLKGASSRFGHLAFNFTSS